MRMFAGLDVSFKQTAVCVVDDAGSIAWGDAHPEALVAALRRWEEWLWVWQNVWPT